MLSLSLIYQHIQRNWKAWRYEVLLNSQHWGVPTEIQQCIATCWLPTLPITADMLSKSQTSKQFLEIYIYMYIFINIYAYAHTQSFHHFTLKKPTRTTNYFYKPTFKEILFTFIIYIYMFLIAINMIFITSKEVFVF